MPPVQQYTTPATILQPHNMSYNLQKPKTLENGCRRGILLDRRHILIVIARSLIYLVQLCMDISSFSGILQEIPPSLSCLRLEDLESLVGNCIGLQSDSQLKSPTLGKVCLT